MRSVGELRFEARRYPEGFRDLVLKSGASRRSPASWALVGVGSGSSEGGADNDVDICKSLFSGDGDPVIGPAGADVTIVEFLDYQCPYCRIVSEFLGEIQANDPRVRLVFKEWPIFGADSEFAARAALAAAQQGQYLRFHRALMATRGIPNEAVIRHAAGKSGVDPARLLADMKTTDFDAIIQRNKQLAKKIGLIGTPSFVVGRTIVQGAITRTQLEKLIDLEASPPRSGICADTS